MPNPSDSSDIENNADSDSERISSLPVTPEIRPMNPRDQVENKLRLYAIGIFAPNPYNPQQGQDVIDSFIRERLAIFDSLCLEEQHELSMNDMHVVSNRLNPHRGVHLPIQHEFRLLPSNDIAPPSNQRAVQRSLRDQRSANQNQGRVNHEAEDPQGRNRDRNYSLNMPPRTQDTFFGHAPVERPQEQPNPEAGNRRRRIQEARYNLIRRALFNHFSQEQHSSTTDSSDHESDVEQVRDTTFNRKL